jgi:hypothetical protein
LKISGIGKVREQCWYSAIQEQGEKPMSLRALKFMLMYAMGCALLLLVGCGPNPVAFASAIGGKQVLATGVIFTREGGLQLNYDPQQGRRIRGLMMR